MRARRVARRTARRVSRRRGAVVGRRRPVLRAAATAALAGGAYYAGKKAAESGQDFDDFDSPDYNSPNYNTPVYDAPPATTDRVTQLKELAALRDSGILTDAEFEQEKQRILGG